MSSFQKRLAARILKVGNTKVWLDPSQKKDIDAAITGADIKKLIQKGYIKKLPAKIKFVKTKQKRKRKAGSRKGSKFSVVPSKRKWIQTVRPLRSMLKEMRKEKQIESKDYKTIYKLIKGGMFRNRSHMKLYMEQHGLIKKK